VPIPDRRLAELLWQRRTLPRELLSACLQRAEQSGSSLRQVLLREGHLDTPTLEQAESALVRPHAGSLPPDPERAPGPGGTLRLDSNSDQRPALGSRAAAGVDSDRGGYPTLEATHRDPHSPQAGSGPRPRAVPEGPRRVGPYEILGELGRGGMGAVYRARHGQTGQVVALKTLHLGGDEEDLQRFRREADLAWQLDHPGIVRVLDVGSDGALRYLVLELLEGGSLQARLARQGPFPVSEVLRVGLSLADALAHAHSQGVLHRDLKPANVIFDGAGRPKLADFGLAQGPNGHSLTTTGSILGTPAYMAPEQARDSKRVDERTDVYGLAALLYGVLSGRPPVVAASLHEALAMLEQSEPPALRTLRPEISAELEAVFRCALARDPAERYSSVVEFAKALRALDSSEPSAGSRQGPLLVGVALAALVLGVALTLALGRSGDPANSSPPGASPTPTPSVAPSSSPGAKPTARATPTPGASSPSASSPGDSSPGDWGPLPEVRSKEPASSELLLGLQAGGQVWEGALTWTSTAGGQTRALCAYVRQTLVSSAPWRAEVELLRLRARDAPPASSGRTFETNYAGQRGALPLLHAPKLWGTLEVAPDKRLVWTPRSVPILEDDARGGFSAWIRERLSEPYGSHWVQAYGLRFGSWGDPGRRGQGQGLEWAAWVGPAGIVSIRRVKTNRIVPGKPGYLSVTHRESYPALASFNDIRSCNVVGVGELFEEPHFPPPTGGKRATLSEGTWLWTAPQGWPRHRLLAPQDVFVLDHEGPWRRVQWGAGYAYVRESFLKRSEAALGVEVVADSRHKGVYPWVKALSADPRKLFGLTLNGAIKGQRFVPTGNERGGHVEVFFDHRRGWIPAKAIREVRPRGD
jgi:serine/threonine protein kinase